MTDKIRNLLEDVQTVYEGKRMVVHPNSFDQLRMEVIKLEEANNKLLDVINNQDVKIADLEKQIEKLIDFVLSKTDCCDVCPETDTCINSEGTCPYAGILAKGEKEVTREWLMQFISRR